MTVNLNARLGPFKVLNMNSMKVAWFYNFLLPAYEYNWRELRMALQKLDAEMFRDMNPKWYHIWAWTWHVRWQDIEVIIVGNQPSNKVAGSGLAFHPLNAKEVSDSTREIFCQLATEFQLRNPNDNENFSLDGWTKQGVVLVNAKTTMDRNTKDRNGKEHNTWLPIMGKLMKYIYNKRPNIQFILVGESARDNLLQECHQYGSSFESQDDRIPLAQHPMFGCGKSDKNLARCLRKCSADVKWAALDMWGRGAGDINNNRKY